MNWGRGRIQGRWVLVAVSILALPTLSGCQKTEAKPMKPGPTQVLYTSPTEDQTTDFEDFTGRTEGFKTVQVRARVNGYLEKIQFKDGSEVNEGDVLFQIDPRPYQAALERAQATLAQAEARQKRLEADNRRATEVFSRGALSREEFDRFSGDLAEAKAAVDIAKANLRMSKLDREYCQVLAPISGQISRRMIDVGNLVQADTTPLTTIVTLDPIYVYFDVDERTLLRVRRLIREGKIRARKRGELTVWAGLADEAEFPHECTVDFSDNRLDPNTGTLQVRGVLPNPKPRVFSPGLFIRVRLPIGDPHKVLLVDEAAVGTDQGRKFVYAIDDQDEVVYKPIKVGALVNGKRVVESGLKGEERIIISGLQRIKPGAKVVAKRAEADSKSQGTGG